MCTTGFPVLKKIDHSLQYQKSILYYSQTGTLENNSLISRNINTSKMCQGKWFYTWLI